MLPVLGAVAGGPVHLLGHHTGAMIGAALAARQRVDAAETIAKRLIEAVRAIG